MPILRVDNVGATGLVTDLLPHELPVNAWTGAQNVRFRDNKAQKFMGHEEYFDPGLNWDGGTGEIAYYVLPVASGANYYWIYCGLKDVFIYDGSTATEITNVGADYAATAARNWTGGIISSVVVLNNGIDEPQFISDYSTPGKLADLTGWTASDSCGAMRVYKNYLIAMDVTKSGQRYPAMVKWSDGAGLGAVPASWDETDATTDAGENDLAESRTHTNVGAILDSCHLRDSNIIYTDSSVWAMQFIGGSLVFQFRELFQNIGMLARRCVQEFEGKHFVVGQNDVYVHNGTTYQSVIDNRRKRFLFSDMDGSEYEKTYVYANYAEKEMWVCYVESGHLAALPNKALVWNWSYNTWGVRDLPNNNAAVGSGGYGTPHIEGGVVDTSSGGDTWATNDGTWDTWTVPWGNIGYNPQEQSPLMAADKLYKGDSTDQFDGTSMTTRLERQDIPLGVPDQGTQDDIVRIKRIYPRIDGNAAVNIYVGSQMAPGDAVDYQSPVSFTPGTDRKVDVRRTGNHAAIRFESTGNQQWSLSGYDIEYEIVGKR